MAKAERRYWDSCAFLAYLKGEENRVDDCELVLKHAQLGRVEIVTSAVTLVEVLRANGQPELSRLHQEEINAAFRHSYITLANVDRPIAEFARELIWEHNLTVKDSIHVGTALILGISRMDTYDNALLDLNPLTINDRGPLSIRKPGDGESVQLSFDPGKLT